MLAQYHQGQVTVTRLVPVLEVIGVQVTKRQVERLMCRAHLAGVDLMR